MENNTTFTLSIHTEAPAAANAAAAFQDMCAYIRARLCELGVQGFDVTLSLVQTPAATAQ